MNTQHHSGQFRYPPEPAGYLLGVFLLGYFCGFLQVRRKTEPTEPGSETGFKRFFEVFKVSA